jgi:ABC-type nickel/cobalt efflux system permease component RcnA
MVLKSSYVASMNWQQLVSLTIVGIAAALLLWSRIRRRKFSFERATHCGCSGSGHEAGSQPSVIYRARKGERPQIVIRMQ